jgi:hypothetical protein
MKFVSLLLVVCSAGCLSTPGIEEPIITECKIIVKNSALILDCYKSDNPTKFFEMDILDAIGYSVVPTADVPKINGHHEALHTELNRCKSDNLPLTSRYQNLPSHP